MFLSLYGYEAKASWYRKGLQVLEKQGNHKSNQTLHSQKLKRKKDTSIKKKEIIQPRKKKKKGGNKGEA